MVLSRLQHRFLATLLTGSALFLAACTATPAGAPSAATAGATVTSRSTDAIAAAEGLRWSLRSLGTAALPAQLPLQQVPYVELQAGRVTGSGGCNRIGSSAQPGGSAATGDIRLGPAMATRMACAEGMDLEQRFLQVFPQVARWQVVGTGTGRVLRWLDAQGAELASFDTRINPWRCEDVPPGEGRSTVLTQHEATPPGHLRLLLQGREYRLYAVTTASGERYAVEQGRRSDWSMEWRSQGSDAQLMEAPLSDSRKPDDLKTFLRCKAEARAG